MTTKKRLMGCIEISHLVYPENFSLQELLPLSEEPITVKQDVKERVYIPEKQKVKE